MVHRIEQSTKIKKCKGKKVEWEKKYPIGKM